MRILTPKRYSQYYPRNPVRQGRKSQLPCMTRRRIEPWSPAHVAEALTTTSFWYDPIGD